MGALGIYGTVNDLAVVGATPRYISTAFIIEEGFSMTTLKEVVHKMHQAAVETNVAIITGDTKVVPKGFGGGVYINTTGVGDSQDTPIWDTSLIRPGDHVLVSGSVGDHGACVLLAREDYGLHGQLKSDCASVFPLVNAIRDLEGVRFVRDPTRGGLSVLLHDVATETGFNIELILKITFRCVQRSQACVTFSALILSFWLVRDALLQLLVPILAAKYSLIGGVKKTVKMPNILVSLRKIQA